MADTSKTVRADDDIALDNLTEVSSEIPSGKQDPELVLASFRNEWKRELEAQASAPPASPKKGLSLHSRLAQINNVETLNSEESTFPKSHSIHSRLALEKITEERDSRGGDESVGAGGKGIIGNSDNSASGAENVVGSIQETSSSNDISSVEDVKPDVEQRATELFNKAVESEQSGQLYEAIQFYRKAMALVPDIEFRVHQHNMRERSEGYHGPVAELPEDPLDEDELDDEEIQDLVVRFQNIMTSHAMCEPQFDQEAPHISCLPPEMLDRIMCWVVGGDLDIRSLEQVSKVCHGFYLIARNPEIWHKACLRVWGIGCGLPGPYGSWREMFIQRPHPRYNGCYISRTTYFRPGDCSFQDQKNCQPWHIVHYYRYVRFFTNGKVVMVTTPEEPQSVVGNLRTEEYCIGHVVQGHYRMHGSNVLLVLKKQSRNKMNNKRKGRRHFGGTTDVEETTFQIEFEIRPVKERPHWSLAWRNYTINYLRYSGEQSVSDIDLNDTSKFPNLTFSRVKSYTGPSVTPLS